MFEIYTENGVFWGSAKGSTFAEACSNFFSETEEAQYQVREGEFDPKELTIYGAKLVEKTKQ
jgi:hypothetical protein